MLQPLRPNPRQQKVAIGRSIPAPVEGWDTVSPLADMKPLRAIILDNFFPQPGYIEIRKGHELFATCTGEADDVETIMPYDSGGSQKLFAAAGQDIYDVTAGGASSSSLGSLNSAQWRYVNFVTSGGHFLWICNGVDDPRHYNGTVWATPSLTGVTANTIRYVTAHKSRLWFVFNNSLAAGYLGTDAVAGAVTTFALGSRFSKGGKLVAAEGWTIDGGEGPDDYLAFLTSRGQVAVYQGTDPSSASTWALVGVYNLGTPIGDRPMLKVAGDVIVITVDGVIPLSRALTTERAASDSISLSARIDSAINEVAKTSATDYGWQLISYPRGTAAILNVPVDADATYHQYVMNVVTGAWARYTGQNAKCWELMGDRIFFGGFDGKVYEADMGAQDNDEAIVADCKTAFNYFGMKGVSKKFGMIQSLVTTDGRAPPAVSLDIDFRDGVSLGALEPPISSDTLWDVAEWDVDEWPPEQVTSGDWDTVTGIGQCAAVRLRISSGDTSSFLFRANGWHITFEVGEFL